MHLPYGILYFGVSLYWKTKIEEVVFALRVDPYAKIIMQEFTNLCCDDSTRRTQVTKDQARFQEVVMFVNLQRLCNDSHQRGKEMLTPITGDLLLFVGWYF